MATTLNTLPKLRLQPLEVHDQVMQANGTPRAAHVLLQVLEASRLSFQRG